MKKIITLVALLVSFVLVHAQTGINDRNRPFDEGWSFQKDDSGTAYLPGFDDSNWRTVDLPHDWSIEDLPNQTPGSLEGPFSKNSVGKSATGFTVGGTGWYRKKFTITKADLKKLFTISFDGVYMNSDVWINGHHLGNHPYGYTPFSYDLTSWLKPAGKQNILAVRVQNEGKNSRWYSGSGIYRHVLLTATAPVHIAENGIFITSPEVSADKATLQIKTTIRNEEAIPKSIMLVTTILNPDGKPAGRTQKVLILEAGETKMDEGIITVNKPARWSIETPRLYKSITEIKEGVITIDREETVFGIRSIHFDAITGFTLNGKKVLLKGGCIHHDNGPLGAAAIDRAEERKIELLKKNGYNAIRLSHNPPSRQLLDACDRLGMLVMDEAFDMWNNAKNPDDYHLYFKDWWKKDLQAILTRDRNHPSVIMWSIGNEIYEAPDSIGRAIAKQLSDEVRSLDPTRPVTEAIIFLPPYTRKSWAEYEPHLANLDIDGYNYFLEKQSIYFQRDSATANRFETEHAKHPQKTFMSTEYLAVDALENWEHTENYPYFLGGFKWTAMDYMGEAGIGRPLLVAKDFKLPKGMMGMGLFYKDSWPVFNAYCGDLDLIGNRKGASYYQNVVWRNSPVEMLVHRPIPDSLKEAIAPWGSPDELKSWTWPGDEGKKIQVAVYTRSKLVRLELNGKLIAEQTLPSGSITALFEIVYRPGILVAKCFDGNKQTSVDSLTTTGKPVAIRLKADRKIIKAGLNDLCYVNAEVIDEKGHIVPYLNDLELTYELSGPATIAGVGNGNFEDMSSFQQNHKKVFQGRGLVIVRPKSAPGKIILKASAKGLAGAAVEIITK